jgi:hypothetical protein
MNENKTAAVTRAAEEKDKEQSGKMTAALWA